MKRTHLARPMAHFCRSEMGGFTLIEIMVVVVILGILAAIVAPNVMSRIGDAQRTKVSSDIRTIETALNLYRMDNFRYPTTEQGIKALYQKPNDSTVRNWKEGGYLDSGNAKDPWGNPYRYVYPGTHGKEFDIFTYGADNQEGGEKDDADIGNWSTEKEQ
jgi:general secretion pathway protein G